MSTLRKVGAFLGLVPDERRYAGDADDANGAYRADGYHDEVDSRQGAGYPDDYAGGYRGADDDADPADYGYHDDLDDHAGAGHESDYRSADYRGADYRGADYREADYRAAAYYDAGDTDAADGYLADDHAAGNVAEYAMAGSAHDGYPDRAAQDTARRAGGRGLSLGGASPAQRGTRSGEPAVSDYRTQGALAVQTDVRVEDRPMAAAAGKPATITLSGFGDARQVGETYRDGQAVILDMTELTDAEARRMVDFAAGLAFASRGSIDKVTTKVFMLHQPTD